MPDQNTIKTHLENGVLSISINRPSHKNALTQDMYLALFDALCELDNNPKARAGFITGTQDCFTAGNDLNDFLATPFKPEEEPPAVKFVTQLPQVKKPLVAAVNGVAVGVGTTLLLHCDFVYVAETAKLQLPFANLGLCPEAGASLLLPQLVGKQKAAELLMLGEAFNGQTAKAIGLANEVFESGSYQQLAYAKAVKLAQQPTNAIQTTKKLLKQANAEPLKNLIALELNYFADMLSSPEAKEAMTAFFEKRQPDFMQFEA